MGVIAIFMTVRVRQGIWGLVAGRTRLRLFPVGYHVEPAAEAPTSGPTASQVVSERPWSPSSTVMLNPDKRRQR